MVSEIEIKEEATIAFDYLPDIREIFQVAKDARHPCAEMVGLRRLIVQMRILKTTGYMLSDMDGKTGDFAHGFPEVLAQCRVGKDQVLEFVAFEFAGHGIGHQG